MAEETASPVATPSEYDEQVQEETYCTEEECTAADVQNDEDMDELVEIVLNLELQETSTYVPSSQESTSSSDLSDAADTGCNPNVSRRMKLNEFLLSCNVPTVGPSKKSWTEASARTKKSHIAKAKALVVAGLNVIVPGDGGHLWQALRDSREVEKEFGISEESPEEQKYLNALAETYRNATCWETRRQVLSIMADLVSFKQIQYYIPGLTEYRFKIARHHTLQYGRGAEIPKERSPRLRVELTQLDHFLAYITSPHVTQDLPFGQRYLRLSSGQVLETPNVIRTMIPSRLVRQYQAYCQETGFKPFGAATMLRILSTCSATVRKSLQGLDDTAAAGGKGFDDLCSIIDKLEEGGLSKETAKSWARALKEGKQYLKSDFKVHVSEASSVADHCSTYALNDIKESQLQTPCQHTHDQSCWQCENLLSVLQSIKGYLSNEARLSQDESDDLLYIFKQSEEAITSWKAHQLRSVRQDKARTDCLNRLDESSVLITQDWAMKFLPTKYRESQSDWFGKRGISWHISVVARKVEGQLQSQAFVHIIENSLQDSSAVVRIMEHTLRTLKSEHPEITSAFIRQDNAGCYHNSVLLATCSLMQTKTGVSVHRVDFSDPQGGKGACDRKAATIKAHIRRHINEGHDVQNAKDFIDAMLSNGGINGVRTVHVDVGAEGRCIPPEVKLAGVSCLNNFQYSEQGVTVWRAFEVGHGRLIDQSQIEVPNYLQNCSFVGQFSSGDFVSVSQEKSIKVRENDDEQPAVETDKSSCELLGCPNEGCIKMYQRHSSLEKHLLFGQCKMVAEKETLYDMAIKKYHALLADGTSEAVSATPDQGHTFEGAIPLPEGWALKSTKKATRFNDAQRSYLEDKFNLGQATGQKQDPNVVARDMRFARKMDGTKRFKSDDYLSAQQIQGFFSRMAAKLRHGELDLLEEDIRAAEEEQMMDDTRQAILEQVQLRHPIVYDTLDICAMYREKRLKQLSIAMLNTVCIYFDISTEGFNSKRKAEYIAVLSELVLACDCCK
ncbi:uncharacterized protein LOC144634549 [Oculina patagonica]